MRSPRAFAGAIVLLAGVVLALIAGMTFDGAGSAIIHAALGVSFVLFAAAAFDFAVPAWIAWTANAAIGLLGALFLLQCASDVLQNPTLDHFAYEQLGQRFEKVLGFAFIGWCTAIALLTSRGATKVMGLIIIAAVLAIEAYSFAMAQSGTPASEAWKLTYLLLFVWLLLEARKPRAA